MHLFDVLEVSSECSSHCTAVESAQLVSRRSLIMAGYTYDSTGQVRQQSSVLLCKHEIKVNVLTLVPSVRSITSSCSRCCCASCCR